MLLELYTRRLLFLAATMDAQASMEEVLRRQLEEKDAEIAHLRKQLASGMFTFLSVDVSFVW